MSRIHAAAATVAAAILLATTACLIPPHLRPSETIDRCTDHREHPPREGIRCHDRCIEESNWWICNCSEACGCWARHERTPAAEGGR